MRVYCLMSYRWGQNPIFNKKDYHQLDVSYQPKKMIILTEMNMEDRLSFLPSVEMLD